MITVRENLTEFWDLIVDYGRNRKDVVYGGLGITVGVIVAAKYLPRLRKRFFAYFNSKAIQIQTEEYLQLRKELFVTLGDVKSHDPALQKENSIRILEIGVGVGTNLPHYPDGCHLVVVDPNPYFIDYYNENRAKYPNVKSESVIVSKGEDMDMVKSGSIDVVVTSAVLCSVTDMTKVVSQIKRVLAPGGKYFFLEHVREFDSKKHGMRLFMQRCLSLFLWPGVFENCHLNRDPLTILNAAGFSDVKAEHLYAPMPCAAFTVCSPHLRGIATK